MAGGSGRVKSLSCQLSRTRALPSQRPRRLMKSAAHELRTCLFLLVLAHQPYYGCAFTQKQRETAARICGASGGKVGVVRNRGTPIIFCCPSTCRSCGGGKCSSRKGCCTGPVLSTNKSCIGPAGNFLAPCLLTADAIDNFNETEPQTQTDLPGLTPPGDDSRSSTPSEVMPVTALGSDSGMIRPSGGKGKVRRGEPIHFEISTSLAKVPPTPTSEALARPTVGKPTLISETLARPSVNKPTAPSSSDLSGSDDDNDNHNNMDSSKQRSGKSTKSSQSSQLATPPLASPPPRHPLPFETLTPSHTTPTSPTGPTSPTSPSTHTNTASFARYTPPQRAIVACFPSTPKENCPSSDDTVLGAGSLRAAFSSAATAHGPTNTTMIVLSVVSNGTRPAFEAQLESVAFANPKLLAMWVAVALDKESLAHCKEQKEQNEQTGTEGPHCALDAALGGTNVNGSDKSALARMSWRKVELVGIALRLGVSVMYTDVDVAWLRDPRHHLKPGRDLQMSPTRMNTEYDAANKEATADSKDPSKCAVHAAFYFARASSTSVMFFLHWLRVGAARVHSGQWRFHETQGFGAAALGCADESLKSGYKTKRAGRCDHIKVFYSDPRYLPGDLQTFRKHSDICTSLIAHPGGSANTLKVLREAQKCPGHSNTPTGKGALKSGQALGADSSRSSVKQMPTRGEASEYNYNIMSSSRLRSEMADGA